MDCNSPTKFMILIASKGDCLACMFAWQVKKQVDGFISTFYKGSMTVIYILQNYNIALNCNL